MAEFQLYCFAQSGNAYRAALMLNLIGADWKPVWIFDNQKVNGFLGPFRFLKNFAPKPADPAVMTFLKGRIDGSLAIVNKRLMGRQFLVSDKPTIADISMTGYLYYPAEEFGFDIAKEHPALAAWLARMQALPGWKHPYDLMPGYPFGTQGYRNQ